MWIKNNKNDTKEGLINKLFFKINSTIDAAYWIARRSTVCLFSGTYSALINNKNVFRTCMKINENSDDLPKLIFMIQEPGIGQLRALM